MNGELRDYYLRALPGRIEALDAARAALTSDAEARANVRRIAHSLKGSGASYGFPRISEAAGAAETAPDGELDVSIGRLLDVLRSTVTGATLDRSRHLVLVVDDDAELTHLLRATLSATGRVVVADSRAAAERFLVAETPSLILLDLVLPDGDGRSLLMRLRERPATAAVPIVVLTATSSERAHAECIALGADQVVRKPFDPAVIAGIVRQQIQRLDDARDATYRDGVTGLANRAGFADEWARARQSGESPLRIALLGVDRFDEARGAERPEDEPVRAFARLATETLARARSVARWGTTEFAALYAGVDASSAEAELDELLARWRAHTADGAGAGSACAGLADANQADEVESASADARRFLYLAKASGGNRLASPERPVDAPARRILLAEDDELTAALVLHRLRREGFQVDHHATGTAALEAARDRSYALAILDVKMPGMDGFELLRELRASGDRQMPILMLTSMGSEEDVVRGLQLGATDYVLKPFSPVELVARVHRHLR